MEQLGSLCETQMRLCTYIFRVEDEVQLPLIHGGKGHSFGSVQLAWIEHRRLDTLSLDQLLFLGKVVPHHPLDLLILHTK